MQKKLASRPVCDNKIIYTLLRCQQITWAIINNGHNYFSTRFHPNNALNGKRRKPYPKLLAGDLILDIHLEKPIIRGNHPREWGCQVLVQRTHTLCTPTHHW
jgi:hypothetical protein